MFNEEDASGSLFHHYFDSVLLHHVVLDFLENRQRVICLSLVFRQVRQFLRLFVQDFSDDGAHEAHLLHAQNKDCVPEFIPEFPGDVFLPIAHDGASEVFGGCWNILDSLLADILAT